MKLFIISVQCPPLSTVEFWKNGEGILKDRNGKFPIFTSEKDLDEYLGKNYIPGKAKIEIIEI